jgi:hypothetical protein
MLIGFHLLWPSKVLGRCKSLLRPLMLRCLDPRSMRPRCLMLTSLMPWCLSPWCLIRYLMPWSLILGLRSSAMMSLSGHFFLGFGLLCF